MNPYCRNPLDSLRLEQLARNENLTGAADRIQDAGGPGIADLHGMVGERAGDSRYGFGIDSAPGRGLFGWRLNLAGFTERIDLVVELLDSAGIPGIPVPLEGSRGRANRSPSVRLQLHHAKHIDARPVGSVRRRKLGRL